LSEVSEEGLRRAKAIQAQRKAAQSGARRPFDVEATHRAVEMHKREFANVQIEGVRTFADLPEAAKNEAARRGLNAGNVPAVWFDGKVYIVEDMVPASQVRKTVFHEAVGHDGLRKVLGERYDVFLENVFQSHESEIKAFAE